MEAKTIGIVAALGSAASWALGAILFKKLTEQLSSPGMAMVKSLISAAILGMVLLVVGFQKIQGEALVWLIVSGVVGIAVGDTLFFAALKELAPQTLIVLMTSGQILTVLLAVLLLGEKPTLNTWIGIVLVTAGITVVLRANLSGEKQKSQRRGVILGGLFVICMSTAQIIAKLALKNVSDLEATFVRMLTAGLAMLALNAFRSNSMDWLTPFRTSGLFGQFLASVCVITFGGFWLSMRAIKYLDVSVATTLLSVEPLFVLPLAAFFLKEKITLRAVTGSVAAVAGISFLCFKLIPT
jgi:drug/metabolite transporter (DMT)-like permease